MKQNGFSKIVSTVVPLKQENVDTDQIIPARFLKVTERVGFGENLFRDWRYASDGTPKNDFVLNNKTYSGQILVAGKNFGCGSSREHAAWALSDYGFKAVISSFFADIFKNNALINNLLPATVSESFLAEIFEHVEREPKTVLEIDIATESIKIQGAEHVEKFPIEPYRKMCLMQGYDDIDYLISRKSNIQNFEKTRKNDFSLS